MDGIDTNNATIKQELKRITKLIHEELSFFEDEFETYKNTVYPSNFDGNLEKMKALGGLCSLASYSILILSNFKSEIQLISDSSEAVGYVPFLKNMQDIIEKKIRELQLSHANLREASGSMRDYVRFKYEADRRRIDSIQ